MRWYQAAREHVTAAPADPFRFQPMPAAPGPAAPAAPRTRPSEGRPTVPPEEPVIEEFEGRDKHIRSIQKQLAGLDEGRLATLADAMARGETFWQNLSVSPATEPKWGPDMGPQMPPQTEVQDPASADLRPAKPPAPGTPEAWENQQDKLNYERRLTGTEETRRRPPGAHFE